MFQSCFKKILLFNSQVISKTECLGTCSRLCLHCCVCARVWACVHTWHSQSSCACQILHFHVVSTFKNTRCVFESLHVPPLARFTWFSLLSHLPKQFSHFLHFYTSHVFLPSPPLVVFRLSVLRWYTEMSTADMLSSHLFPPLWFSGICSCSHAMHNWLFPSMHLCSHRYTHAVLWVTNILILYNSTLNTRHKTATVDVQSPNSLYSDKYKIQPAMKQMIFSLIFSHEITLCASIIAILVCRLWKMLDAMLIWCTEVPSGEWRDMMGCGFIYKPVGELHWFVDRKLSKQAYHSPDDCLQSRKGSMFVSWHQSAVFDYQLYII